MVQALFYSSLAFIRLKGMLGKDEKREGHDLNLNYNRRPNILPTFNADYKYHKHFKQSAEPVDEHFWISTSKTLR